MIVYLAGPVFTQAERVWNVSLRDALEATGHEVILPQAEAARLISESGGCSAKALFDSMTASINRAECVVAIFDGPDVDSGTSWECGYATALGKPVIGLRTDIRQGGDGTSNVNLMLSESSKSVVEWRTLVDGDNVNALADEMSAKLRLLR